MFSFDRMRSRSKVPSAEPGAFTLSDAGRKMLLRMARGSLESAFAPSKNREVAVVGKTSKTPGAFVILHRNGRPHRHIHPGNVPGEA